MKTTVFRYFTLVVSLFVASMFVSCSDDKNEPDNNGNESSEIPEIELPAIYELVKGEPREITLAVKKGKVEASDIISLQLEGSGTYTPCTIGSFTESSLTFDFPTSLSEGTYTVVYRRGQSMRTCGKMQVRITEKTFEPQPGTTIYGVVSTAEGPLEGVLVSDGTIFAKTNADGQYELASDKPLPYVFMVVPSGYEPECNGVFPAFFHRLLFQDDKTKAEAFNFTLKKVDQSRYNVLFFGDMHLAARNGDIGQFTEFTKDVNKYVAGHPGEKFYAITLGDMTWDIYWNQFTLDNYVEKVNALFDDLMIYHTIGNHDNDMDAVRSNYDAKIPYRQHIGPNYYSFNIGDVHYISLDDIDCSAYENGNRKYSEYVMPEQIEWLKKDLSYVDKSTPVIVTLHAPVFGVSSATQFKNSIDNANTFISCFDGYKVDIVSGHTHKNYNVTSAHNVLSGKDIREHNKTAVCGDWWWSGKLSGVLMAPDGSPAGYSIWSIDGKNIKWIDKATNKDTDVQFRSYDLNEVEFTFAGDVPNLPTDSNNKAYQHFKRYVDGYKKNTDDYVLINVWNYDPSWTITVTQEDGKELKVEPRMAYDPLHIAAMSVKRFNNDITSVPNFVTQSYPHFFRVQATNHDVDLKITVKDEFGNVWTEDMQRPKPFGKSDAELKAYK